MTSRTHVRLAGTVSIRLAPSEAFELFTPTGERRWAAGWDPTFPAPGARETTPGTVFQTKHSQPVTWVVVGCEPGQSITYANVSEGDRAGLIRVSCEPNQDGTTTANVTYELTALSDEGEARLHQFAAHYEQFLAHRQGAIDDAVSNPGR